MEQKEILFWKACFCRQYIEKLASWWRISNWVSNIAKDRRDRVSLGKWYDSIFHVSFGRKINYTQETSVWLFGLLRWCRWCVWIYDVYWLSFTLYDSKQRRTLTTFKTLLQSQLGKVYERDWPFVMACKELTIKNEFLENICYPYFHQQLY